MKLVKIKNLPNKQEIIKWLINLLIESESSYSPLISESIHPTENFYILTYNKILLPAYILSKDNEALVLWVHKDYRKKGYGKFMVNTLGIKHAVAAPRSIHFWEKLGFKRISNGSGKAVMKRIF